MSRRRRKKGKKIKKKLRSRKRNRQSRNKKKIRKKLKSKSSSKKPILTKDEDGNVLIKVSDNWANQAFVNQSKYKKKYNLSVKENENFWKKEGKRITWIKPYTKIKDVKYSKEDVKIKWFYDGSLNASVNCIDRHLKKKWK